MEKIKFCLVGCGRAGLVHAKNITQNISNAELTSIVDNNDDVLKKNGEELGVSKLFKELDDAISYDDFNAVVIGAPTFIHHDITVKCAAAKKHIFCEKPMCVTIEEAKNMIKTTEQNNVKLQIAFMRRFDPLFLQAKEIIDSGDLGEPIIIKSLARGPGLPAPWYYDISKSNGLLAEMCSHDFDSVRWLSGSEYKSIYAIAVNRKTSEIKKQYPDFYDSVVCSFQMEKDIIGSIDSTCPVGYGFDVRGEVVLTKGFISIGELKGEAFFSCGLNGILKSNTTKSWRNRFKESYMNEMNSFIDSILLDKKPEATGEDGLAAVEAVIAGNESIKKGIKINLKQN